MTFVNGLLISHGWMDIANNKPGSYQTLLSQNQETPKLIKGFLQNKGSLNTQDKMKDNPR